MTPQEILALPITEGNRSDAKTVGQYLVRCAEKAFMDQEAVYPFGNSDYETPLIFAFAHANLIWLRTDEDSLIDDYPEDDFGKIVQGLYDFLFLSKLEGLELPPEPKEWYLVCVERGKDHSAYLTDYFGEAFTEEEAKTKAEAENKHYDYHAWVAVHIPA